MTKVFMTLPDGTKHEIKPFTAKVSTNIDREKIRLELKEELKKFLGVKATKKVQNKIIQILGKFLESM